MKVTYIGYGPTPPAESSLIGVPFKMNVPVEITDPFILKKAKGNRCFSVGDTKNGSVVEIPEIGDITYHEKLKAVSASGVDVPNKNKETIEGLYASLPLTGAETETPEDTGAAIDEALEE